MKTINELQDEVIEEFSNFDDWMDKYQLLIDLGNEQEPLAPQYKTEQNLIDGCQSRVWLQSDLTDDGKIIFQAEDGIRDRSPSRGLGDVYKRQTVHCFMCWIRMCRDCLRLNALSCLLYTSDAADD